MANTKKTSKPKARTHTSERKFTKYLKNVIRFFRNDTVVALLGLILSLFGLFLFIALTSFFFTGASDQSLVENTEFAKIEKEINNWAGIGGAYLSNLLINKWLGLGAFVFTYWLCMLGMYMMRVIEDGVWKNSVRCILCCIIVSLAGAYICRLFDIDSFIQWGGNHGNFVIDFLFKAIGKVGTGLIIFILLVIFLTMISRSTIDFIRNILKTNPLKNPFKQLFVMKGIKSDKSEEESTEDEDLTTDEDIENTEEMVDSDNGNDFVFISEENNTQGSETPIEILPDVECEIVDVPLEDIQPHAVENNENNEENNDKNIINIDDKATVLSGEGEPTFTVTTGAKEELVDEVLEDYDPTLDLPRYRKPTLELLADLPDTKGSVDRQELESNKKRITDTLMTYGIEISSIQATVGPTVTLYEIIPAPGVRIAKIKNLEDDIALSLAALGIRIIAPIPGKGTVGIEVPNNDPQTVSMRSIIASRKFQESKFELPIALGKTITNEVFVADLTKMPHVLVAGATGQGKSVGLNAIITSLLYKKHPAELKFVLVDPKKVEFSIYSAIERHFLAKLPDTDEPIITDTTKVVQTLQSVTKEMDMRYDLLKMAKVRTIKEYNAKFKSRHLLPSKGHRFLPYIVVIIDEFSDLIMTAGKEVESPIIRIAQLARAVGIHMIIATQRPSTNVITGIIKANFPARIAFRVQSMIDSRTILDCPGANQLIGRGDMLISQGGEMVRVQCAFVDTPEVEDICRNISEQQSYPNAFLLPEYVAEESEIGGGANFDAKDRDSLFEEAARIIVSSQQASTSSLQRRYSIGYNRAGRLMDQLEAAGIVGPAMGGKPREVLIGDIMQLENKLDLMK